MPTAWQLHLMLHYSFTKQLLGRNWVKSIQKLFVSFLIACKSTNNLKIFISLKNCSCQKYLRPNCIFFHRGLSIFTALKCSQMSSAKRQIKEKKMESPLKTLDFKNFY